MLVIQVLMHPAVSGLILMGVIGALTYKLGFVDISGLISAFVVGFTVWYTGGAGAFTILLFFFVSAGLATKFKYKAKAKKNLAQEGKGKRSWKNVFGSGLIPMLFSIGVYVSQMFADQGLIDASIPFWMFGGFIGAVATTSADTLASEVGVFSKSKPRLITNLRRRVPAGTIGGVSLLGEAVALFAGFAIGLIALVYAMFAPGILPITNPSQMLFVLPLSVLTAFIGCNLDSLIGAVAQNRYVCDICGAITDKEFHCGYETKYVGGFKRFTNMHVNFGSSGMGAALGVVLGAGLFVWILGGLFFWLLASSSS
ncbi:DUF92 domain-containing protein [Candidatus Thorarchaeota archaeon]|nr:MAG: DUF92 domain-containing protein [Candidatus Thorarchaeota archaeon]